MVIIRKSLLPPTTPTPSAKLLRKLGLPIPPIVFDYATIAKNNSLYNTLPIFDVYIAGQVMSSLLAQFPEDKVSGQEVIATAKANLLYEFLDKFPNTYKVVPSKKARSRMNICFRVTSGFGEVDESKEAQWVKGAESYGLTGLKGHRSVGGIRISNCESRKVTQGVWFSLTRNRQFYHRTSSAEAGAVHRRVCRERAERRRGGGLVAPSQ
jgi:phosphoserine aminotransferase